MLDSSNTGFGSRPLKVLHITESMASGTMEIISELAKLQSREGNSVHVAHTVRPETPSEADLAGKFPAGITRSVLPPFGNGSLLLTLRAFFRVVRLLHAFLPDVVHLHSSKAGALGRVACAMFGRGAGVFYSPHGFAFLRRDVSKARRWFFAAMERLLSRLGGTVVACSESEASVAKAVKLRSRIVVVENAISMEGLPFAAVGKAPRPLVASSGRLCFQKAPWRFFAMARNLQHLDADFVWIGDGPDQYRTDGSPLPANVRITGWMQREEVINLLARCDVYVLLSLWEGMPLVLIEAQAIGLPAVVADAVGSRDVVQHGETGYVCRSEKDWMQRVTELLMDAGQRQRLGLAAAHRARQRYDTPRMHRETMMLYRRAPGPSGEAPRDSVRRGFKELE